MKRFREIVVDNFAGGGGASTGIEMAIGRSVDIAINHDLAAIKMHKANHPDSEHYCESVWEVDPVKACKGRPVALAWFSPDCKHFSKAKGGKPVDKNIRGLAWVAVKWAKKVKPRVIMLENVEEFRTWGPLIEGKDGKLYPDPDKKGQTFDLFIKALERQGYKVEFRELRACDYGAPTIRRRFFLIARCDGKPIIWPEPTHGDPESLEVRCGLKKPWRTAAEIIDWSLPCKSIFERKKSLAENTLKRIAKGIQKFVIENPNPFIVQIGQNGFCKDDRSYSLEDPLTTIMTKAEHCLVTPYLVVNTNGHSGGSAKEPIHTITTGGHHALLAPTLIQYHTETSGQPRGQAIDKPIATLDASPRYGLVSAFISKYYAGGYNGAGADLAEPTPTITTKDHNAVITSHLVKLRNNDVGQLLNEPVHTITAGGLHFGEVRAFLMTYYGNDEDLGQPCDEPLRTVTSKHRFGVVTIQGQEYQIVDIGMRMLEPHELFAAQGFPNDYIIDRDYEGKPYSKTAQVARCGNAVPPPFTEALTRANLSELCNDQAAAV